MANIYLNGGSTDFILTALREGILTSQAGDRFVLEWNGARLEVSGSGFVFQNGRLAVAAGDGSLVTSLRTFDPGGVERLAITAAAFSAYELQTFAASGDFTPFYNFLFAGDDLVRVGPDETLLQGGPGADTFLGDGRNNVYYLGDPTDRIVEPANGGWRDFAFVEYGAADQLLSFTLGAGQLASIENLTYSGEARIRVAGNGSANEVYGEAGNDTISGGGGNDTLDGNLGDDSLSGGAGDDSLDGGVGRDTLLGGAGHDTIVAIGGANRIDGGSGDDFVESGGPGADTILGGAGNDTIFGGAAGGKLFFGGAGHDSISSSGGLVDGGAGNDTLDAAGTVLGGTGNDLIDGTGLLDGGAGSDSITGNGGSRLLGGAGDDVIGMFFGANTVQGGTGRDLFRLDVASGLGNEIVDFRRGEDRLDISDFIFNAGLGEQSFEDLVRSGVLTSESSAGGLLLRLTAGGHSVEVMLLGLSEVGAADFVTGGDVATGTSGADVIRGTRFTVTIEGLAGNDLIELRATNTPFLPFASGGAGNDTIIGSGSGNAGHSVLAGDAGNDLLVAVTARHELRGGDGNDTLVAEIRAGQSSLAGGAGNDLYLLSDSGASVSEEADAGIDTVGVSFDYTLGDNLEHLFQTDPHATGWRANGNALANRITGGRAGSSDLFGGGGNDTLTGGSGNDTLDGGAGADRMIGGGGDDSYFVDHAGDRIVERANEGYDTVSVTLNAYTLGANLEDLRFAGQGDFRGTGNGVHNRIFGGGGADTLSGGGGNDTLIGGLGADRLTGGTGADTFVIAGDAMDRVTDFSRAQGDRLDLRALVTGVLGSPMTFEQLTGSGVLHWEAQGRDLVLYLGAGTASPITLLQGQAALELQASDFVL